MNGAEDTQCEKYFTPPEKHIFKEEIINKAHQIIEKNLVADGDKHFLSFDGLDELFSLLDEALKELVEGKREEIAKIIYYFDNRGLAYDIPKWESMPDHLQKPYWDKAGQIIKLILEE